MSKSDAEGKIEYQIILGEANPGGYQPIRFTRVKYKASSQTYIDIRKYQRAMDDDGEDVFYPTNYGFRVPENEFSRVIKEYTILPEAYLHQKMLEKCFLHLTRCEYESAVSQAFKYIETRIRQKVKGDPEETGVTLIRKVFHPENGELTNYSLPLTEREAFADYLAGAFGYYKHSHLHRHSELEYISAFDIIAVASELLKIIDRSGNTLYRGATRKENNKTKE